MDPVIFPILFSMWGLSMLADLIADESAGQSRKLGLEKPHHAFENPTASPAANSDYTCNGC